MWMRMDLTSPRSPSDWERAKRWSREHINSPIKQSDPAKNHALALEGKVLTKPPERRISREKIDLIRRHLRVGKPSNRKTGEAVGCGHHTVANEKQRMIRERLVF